ncbi:hypothetical protein FRC04_001078 [Tulasnella sp. 424]|nr:hypothetical protein FRC04_001078 [Tulasnella sp. 424]
MTTPAFDIHNPGGKFEVPAIPEEFGQDGGEFIRRYDVLADEIDDDTVKGLKEQLDGLLIFSRPPDDTNALLRENNAILLQLALGRNDSLPSAQALPSETFSPAGKVLTVNVLFSVSLTLALISSFMAVLGRQWLAYYRKRSGGGPDRQRWEQLKRFLGAERWGLEWALDDFLPSILQIGLIIFCISLTIYLSTLHPTLSTVVGTFMCAGLALFIITALLATWDKFCPFQSPLSHFISVSATLVWGFAPGLTARIAARLILCLVYPLGAGLRSGLASRLGLSAAGLALRSVESWANDLAGLLGDSLEEFGAKGSADILSDTRKRSFSDVLGLVPVGLIALILVPLDLLLIALRLPWRIESYIIGPSEFHQDKLLNDLTAIPVALFLLVEIFVSFVRFASRVPISKRQEEDPGELQILATRRAICTSDDALTQLHGVSNILAISDSHLLDILAADDEFTTRLSELWRGSYSRTLQLRGRDQLELARRIQCLYRAALAHVLLSFSEATDWDRRKRNYDLMLPSDKGSEEQRMLPPSDLMQNLHSNMVNSYLSCISFDWVLDYRKSPGVNSLPPPSSMDVLLNPTWGRISIVLRVIVDRPRAGSDWFDITNSMESLRREYVGDPYAALGDLESVMTKCSDRDRTRESRDILKQYLVPIFKFAGKAAVDRVESRGIGTYPAAKLLCLSETFMRAEDSPSNFINIGRSLRRELISVLATVRERSDLYDEDNPILQHLQAVIRDPGWVDLKGVNSVSEVERLDKLFRRFRAKVESVSLKIKTSNSMSSTIQETLSSIHETAQCASSWECVKAGGINHVLWPLMGLLVIASILLGKKVDEADPEAPAKWGISGTGAMTICGVCVGLACASTGRVVELVLFTLTLLAFAARFSILKHRWGGLYGLCLGGVYDIQIRLFGLRCFLAWSSKDTNNKNVGSNIMQTIV